MAHARTPQKKFPTISTAIAPSKMPRIVSVALNQSVN